MPLHRGDLNDVQWQNFTPAADKSVLVDLLTTLAIINGILWIHRTGALGRFAGSVWVTRYGIEPFYRWRSQGIWQEILNRLQQTAGCGSNRLGGTFLSIAPSSALINRQQQKRELNPGQQSLSVEQMQQQEALGRKKGFSATNSHPSRRHGQTDAVCLDGGTTQRSQRIRHLNTALKVKRTGQGRPQRPRYLVGDKGYDSQTIRRTDAPSAHHTSHPKRKNAKCKPRFNRGLYRAQPH